MAELGTALAIVAFADQCIKYGEKLVRRCKAYRHAEEESRGLVISIEHNWIKTETQITILKSISDSLDARYRDVQARVLSELEGKLKTATLTMDQLIAGEKDEDLDFADMARALRKMAPIKKVKYAFKKEALEKIIEDLENWQRRFDPSWLLIIRMADSKIDQQFDREEKKAEQTSFIMAAKGVRDVARESLASSLTLTPDGNSGSIFLHTDVLDNSPNTRTPIPFSSTLICCLSDGSHERVLVDTMVCGPSADVMRTTKDVRQLARILSKVDPSTFGLLSCRGVIKGVSTTPVVAVAVAVGDDIEAPPLPRHAFKFLFSIPSGLNCPPKSLRTLLIESDETCPLNRRFDLAKQLTSSVLFVHDSQFVHKNIRPETILVFENAEKGGDNDEGDDDGESVSGIKKSSSSGSSSAFLVGFEKFRPAEGITYRVSDGIWQHDLYRHPNRQGTQPEEDYQMQHDIYSLGVVLLELGLWQSFLSFPHQPSVDGETSSVDGDTHPTETSDINTPELAIPPPFLVPLDLLRDARKRALAVKGALISLATQLLPARMGTKYTDIVLLCLQVLDTATGTGAGGEGEKGAFDGGNVWSGGGTEEEEGFVDEDGIVVGVRYIERILLRMQEISI